MRENDSIFPVENLLDKKQVFGLRWLAVSAALLIGIAGVWLFSAWGRGISAAQLDLNLPRVGGASERPTEADREHRPQAMNLMPVPLIKDTIPYYRWGGRAWTVAVHPSSSMVAIISSEGGGLFKTTDSGMNWVHLDSLPVFRTHDVAFHPMNGNLVFATALNDSQVVNGGGIWYSSDEGDTWTHAAVPDTSPSCAGYAFLKGFGIAFAPDNGFIYIGTNCGLAISLNFGSTWDQIAIDSENTAVLSVAAVEGGVVHICGKYGHRLSTNKGMSFGINTLPVPCTFIHGLEVSPLQDNVIFLAGLAPPPDELEAVLYEGHVQIDGSVDWHQAYHQPARGFAPWVAANHSGDGQASNIDVYFGSNLFLYWNTCSSGGSGWRCSTSGWEYMEFPHGADPTHIAFEAEGNCPLYLASDGGVDTPVLSRDPPGTCRVTGWVTTVNAGNGYNALETYDLAGQIRTDGLDLYVGTQDNGFVFTVDGGATISTSYGGEGYDLQIARYPAEAGSDARVLFLSGNGFSFKFSRSMSWLANWHAPMRRSGWGNPGERVTGDLFIQRGPIITGSIGIAMFASPNVDLSWSQIPSTTTDVLSFFGIPQTAIADERVIIYSPISRPSERFELVKIQGLSMDGSYTPTEMQDASGTDFGGLAPSDSMFHWFPYAVDPWDPNHLIAADVLSGSMKITTNGGINWTEHLTLTQRVTGYNPDTGESQFRFSVPKEEFEDYFGGFGGNTQVHVIAFDPFQRGRILVGTDAAGLFFSRDNGQTWLNVPGSEKLTNIRDVFFVEASAWSDHNLAYIATYGRGLWKLDFDFVALSIFGFEETTINMLEPWMLNPQNGTQLPEAILTDPSYCPDCRYLIVKRGLITEIFSDSGGYVNGLNYEHVVQRSLAAPTDAVTPTLFASSVDGFEIAVTLPMTHSSSTGGFTACPICPSFIQGGGEVRGLVLEDGQLKAVIAGSGALPGEEELVEQPPFVPSEGPVYTPPSEPFIRFEEQQGRVLEQATLYGANFSADPSCNPIIVFSDGQVVTDTLQPDPEGNFVLTYTLGYMLGLYKVEAIQKCTMETNQDFTWLLVRHGDEMEDMEPKRLYLPLVRR